MIGVFAPYFTFQNVGGPTRYYQICAILLYLCSIFLYYFSQEVAQEVSNECLMSFMGISPFLSLIYHIEFSLFTDFFSMSLYATLLAQWQDAGMPCGRPGFNSPRELTRLFHLSQISIVDISGRVHRYLFIKDICDVIIQL